MEYAHFFRFLAAQDRRGISTCQRPKVYIQFDEIWGNEPIWKKSENKVTNNVKYQKESAAVIIADWWAADRELSFFIIGREKEKEKKRDFLLLPIVQLWVATSLAVRIVWETLRLSYYSSGRVPVDEVAFTVGHET